MHQLIKALKEQHKKLSNTLDDVQTQLETVSNFTKTPAVPHPPKRLHESVRSLSQLFELLCNQAQNVRQAQRWCWAYENQSVRVQPIRNSEDSVWFSIKQKSLLRRVPLHAKPHSVQHQRRNTSLFLEVLRYYLPIAAFLVDTIMKCATENRHYPTGPMRRCDKVETSLQKLGAQFVEQAKHLAPIPQTPRRFKAKV